MIRRRRRTTRCWWPVFHSRVICAAEIAWVGVARAMTAKSYRSRRPPHGRFYAKEFSRVSISKSSKPRRTRNAANSNSSFTVGWLRRGCSLQIRDRLVGCAGDAHGSQLRRDAIQLKEDLVLALIRLGG